MSYLDPATGLRTPFQWSQQAVGQRNALSAMMDFAPSASTGSIYGPLSPSYGPFAPAASEFSPMVGGIAGLPGGSGGPNGILARAMPEAVYGGPNIGATGLNGARVGTTGMLEGLPYSGGGGGFGSKLAGMVPGGEGGLALDLSKASLLKGAGYGLAGQIGSGLADKYTPGSHNSNLEQGLQGAAQGAGLGAGVGSIVPGIGTGIGAAVGGVAGGAIGILGNMFGKKHKKEDMASGEDILTHAMLKGGVDTDTMAHIIDVYDANLALADQFEGEDKKAAQQQALQMAGQLVLQAVSNPASATSPQASAANTLALQAAAQQTFAPLAENMRDSGQLYGQAMQAMIPDLPAEAQPFAKIQAAREMNSNNRLANAYMAQAAVTPAVQQLTQYQQDYNSFAAQQFSAALAQQAAGQQGGGGTDIAALLQGA